MIKCQSCGRENLDAAQYCDECGTRLKSQQPSYAVKSEVQSDPLPSPVFQPQFSEVSNIQHASVTSVGIPVYVPENGSGMPTPEVLNQANEVEINPPAAKGVHATLLIERGNSIGTEFRLTSDESYIGRWDADNGIFPDVDLDAFDPEAKVSRRHARIVRENNRYAVEDLGSTNGTFINRGRRLIPGNRQPLNDGDEIIVGKTFLRFHLA
jgi:hypothetical protein